MPDILKPEVALKRAKDLLKVNADKAPVALKTLQDLLKNRRYKQWTKSHPEIFKLYIDLCVTLQKSYAAKECLFQCKTLTQHLYPDQLEVVVLHYIKVSRERIVQAKQESKASLGKEESDLKDVDDLDNFITPEALLLNAVTAAGDGERADRQHLTPWVRFLWDCFRQCLDLLRNNKIWENLYKTVATYACKFCIDYERNNEFRKLCDMLRQHLKMITDTANHKTTGTRAQTQIMLVASKIEDSHHTSQQIQTTVRLTQLDTAIALQLWQEAFKAIEDIYLIQQYTRRVQKSYANQSKFKSEFLDYLSKVLLKAGQPFFHAATCHKIFLINREMNLKISAKDLQKLASQTVVATLAIPLTEKQHGLGRMLDMGNQASEKHQRLAKILNYETIPTREQLVQDIQWKGVIRFVPDVLVDLFKNLEIEFNPLRLADRVEKCLKWLKDSDSNPYTALLEPYLTQIQHVTASRVIKQVSEIYETIDFTRLGSLVPFYSPFELEQHILDASRSGALRAKIDHSTSTVNFGRIFDPAPLCVQASDEPTAGVIQAKQEQDWLNQHLNSISIALTKSAVILQTVSDREDIDTKFQAAVRHFQKNDEKTVAQYIQRQKHIEETKEDKEKQEQNRRVEAEQKKQMLEDAARHAEEQRLEEERTQREEKRRVEEEESCKAKYVQETLAQLKLDDKMLSWCEFLEAEDFLKLKPEKIIDKQIEGVRQMRIDMKKSLTKTEEEVDHFERARRQVESEIRKETLDDRMRAIRRHREEQHNLTVTRSKTQHEVDLAYKNKFMHMTDRIAEFTTDIAKISNEQYEIELGRFTEMKIQTIQTKRKQHKDDYVEQELINYKESAEEAKRIVMEYEKQEKRRIAEEELRLQDQKAEEAKQARLKERQQAAEETLRESRVAGGSYHQQERMPTNNGDGRADNRDRAYTPRDDRYRDQPDPNGFTKNMDRNDDNRGGFSRNADPRGMDGPPDGRFNDRNDDRGQDRDDQWRRPNRSPDRNNDRYNDGPRRQEDRGNNRGFDRPSNQDDRFGPRDQDGPPRGRGEQSGGWRASPRDNPGPRDGFGPSAGPRDNDGYNRSPDRYGGPRQQPPRNDDRFSDSRFGNRNDSPQSRDDGGGGGWRRSGMGGPRRDGPPMNDSGQGRSDGPMRRNVDGPGRFDDGGPMRRNLDRPPMSRNDDRPPMSRNDDRPPIRRNDDGPMSRNDDRPPIRRNDDRPPMRRQEVDGPRDGPPRSAWGGGQRGDAGPRSTGPPNDDPRSASQNESTAWRPKSQETQEEPKKPAENKPVEDDGWTSVR